jgi:hypothetical protein
MAAWNWEANKRDRPECAAACSEASGPGQDFAVPFPFRDFASSILPVSVSMPPT